MGHTHKLNDFIHYMKPELQVWLTKTYKSKGEAKNQALKKTIILHSNLPLPHAYSKAIHLWLVLYP